MDRLTQAYAAATCRAARAGVDLLEVHMAHGYLLHSFLSPLANRRNDAMGGSTDNRMRFPLRIAAAVRAAWPIERPMACRISVVDGAEVGWSLGDSRRLAMRLRETGVDLVDCSSGGMVLPRKDMLVPRGPGFQVPFAADIRARVGIATMAVGEITDALQAEEILRSGNADLIAVGRQMRAEPNWALNAMGRLAPEQQFAHWPQQFGWWLARRHRNLPQPDAG